MKIKILETAAAEGMPCIFCDCEIFKQVRLLKRKNIRTRSQAIIDDTLLIDFSADTYIQTAQGCTDSAPLCGLYFQYYFY